ncbi:MAG TPA: right-handed parallel beta-helix repeat-containing protein [Lysobacter sp.]
MLRPVILLALIATTSFAPARAAESYDSCAGFIDAVPAVISTQGTWCLRKDLSTAIAAGAAITINTNNVTIDCNDFKLGGLAAGLGTATDGIDAEGRTNITVRHCNIRGFLYGVFLAGGGGHLVEDNRFDGNTHAGIYVQGSASLVQRNRVVDTGGSPTFAAVGIYAYEGTHVLDNTIEGVMPVADNRSAFGILVDAVLAREIARNRIQNILATAGGTAYGIRANNAAGRSSIVGNRIANANTPGFGISCASTLHKARENDVTGFDGGISGCFNHPSNIVDLD